MEELVRIVVLDFYMASPLTGLDVTYSEFRGNSINQVPILRCFGSTKNGKKICVHIHGVFPYLYIPYDGVGNAEGLMYQIAASIDKAVNTSLNQGSSSTHHVYKISLVSGIPMYGYHPKKHQFFKIYLYNPMLVSTVTNLLLNQSILERVFQPHEAHINFTLQFMIDYNLHGMSNMVITDLKYRVNPDNPNTNIEMELFLPASIEKITTCELEGDINAENILNRQEIINGNLAVNPGIATLWADEKQRRRNKNEDSQLGLFLELKNMKFTPTKTHLIFQQALAERLAVLSTDKDIPKEDLSISVYAAETPNNANIQNASIIDIHTPSSLELSLDDTINISGSQTLDDTIIPTQGNLNMTMDEDAQNFLKLLEQLAEDKAMEDTKEDDSILSQTVREDELNEDFLDLSMPLAAVTTPMKVYTNDIADESDDDNENYFETTLIPQVDGQTEMTDSSDEQIIVYKTSSESNSYRDSTGETRNGKPENNPRCGRSMPLLETKFDPSTLSGTLKDPLNKLNLLPTVKLHCMKPVVKIERRVMVNMMKIVDKHPRTRQWTRKTSEEKLEEHLRLIRFRMNRMNTKSKIKKIGKYVHNKERVIGTLLGKYLRPKFNIVPGRKWFLESPQTDVTSSIISRIIKQTHNYTDPTLHLLVKHPSNKNFLYCYDGKAIPDITEIPSNLFESECMKIISDTYQSTSPKCTERDSIKRQKMKILRNKILNIKEPQQPACKNSVVSETSKSELESDTQYCFLGDQKSFAKFETTVRDEAKQANLALQKHLQQLRDFDVYRAFDKREQKSDILSKLQCINNNNIEPSTEMVSASTLREEAKQANLALQKHLQQLRDFDVYRAFDKQEQKSGVLSKLKCINNNNVEPSTEMVQASTVLYKTVDPCGLSTSKDVNKVLGEIGNIKQPNNISGSDLVISNCPFRILNSFNNGFDSKENLSNVGNVPTSIRSFEHQKHGEFNTPRNVVSPKILADIGGKNISNFESPKNNSKRGNIDSSSDDSESNYDAFLDDNHILSCYTSSQLMDPEEILVASNLTVVKTSDNFERSLKSPDSGYMSLSLFSNSSERNISYGFDSKCSSSKESVSMSPVSHMRINNSLKSSKKISRINTKDDITLERSLHVQCLQHGVSNDLVGSNESSFEYGAGDNSVEIWDISRPYKRGFKPEWGHTYPHLYVPKRIKRRRRSIPNIYINCDGAVDSSSEDEDKIKTKSKKHAKRRKAHSQYAPLQISVSKSPRVQGNCVKAGLADNMTGISEDQANLPENPLEEVQKKSLSKSDVSFKRKLHFENEVSLNNTTSEEFLSCVYLPNNISKTSVSSVINESTLKICAKLDDIHQVEIADTDFDQNSTNSQSANESTSQQHESSKSDSDLFSEDEDMNKSFFKSYHLSTSEKYDKETKYKAKEGCSTIFTPSSIVSQKKSNYQVSSEDTSKDITPNQEAVIPENSQSVSSGRSSENLSSDITPYQNLKQFSNDKERELSSSGIVKILKPAFCAPTRLQVDTSLNELKIAEVLIIEPFYSNVNDYTGIVEVGQNTLRIPSKTTCHLPDFESEFDELFKYRKRFTENVVNLIWNSNNLKSLKLNYCNNRNITIRPIKKSPSVKIVQKWLEENSKVQVLPSTPEDKNTRSKIYIPNSPGNDQDDLELSLSITPCTPTCSQDKLTQSSEPGTPKSSLNSQNSSPILDHRKKKCKKKNFINKQFHLRDSLLSSEEINKSGQITGISHNDTFGFSKSVQNLQDARVVLEHQHLTTMVMELQIRTRGDLKPDPEYDPICAIFYSVLNDVPETYSKKTKTRGVVALNCLPIDRGLPNDHFLDGICINCDITFAETEEDVINKFLSLIKYWDPDILAGYEIQMLSWGYLIDRAFVLSINIIPLLGRSQINKYGRAKQKTTNYEIETAITGRIILDVWRIMKHEIALQSYTFESIVYHILHKRIPMFAFKDLTFWWDYRSNLFRHRVVSYYLLRVETVLELFDKLDFLNRTSELARLFGILFYEVLSRGSQFRVESMMLRLAKPLNYVPVSPSQAQRAKMKAPEYIALVMEPESKLYSDPVIVLDFQSLYPSIIIAYNYCFTTCVGRVNNLGTNTPYEFGATQLKVPRKLVEQLCKRNLLNFSPGGVAFVKQKVRQGILPRMLTEILDTRLMVKNSMKENKGNENLQKVLHNRQLGLKLIANVTYGYTAANFSGRMCCVEVGDSVVSKARETLQRAIALVESTSEWGARVVYGDTDSLFVLVPGKTKETAFEVGKKIADAITADNPDPIKLKLEKVYQPCILQTKKRYVGYMYESPDQKEPVYDAKGIETVRRDGCPAVSKMLQKCLTLLFETKDVSLVKKYILRQFNKIQAGRASIQDLTFAKEYRGASGYKPGACVPALELARKWKAVDRRSEPRSGERVPYIIVNGPPGLPLIRLVRSPRDLLNDSSLRPNSLYYITKVIIPAINRCLKLIGADLHTWFNQMPRKNTLYLPNSSPIVKSTISQYFVSKICASCSRPTQNGLCDRCCQTVNVTAFTLVEKLRKWEENFHNTTLICHSCTGHIDAISCISLDCPVLYRRTQTYNDLQQSTYVRELLSSTDIFSENSVFDN